MRASCEYHTRKGDPAARIERAIRLERQKATGQPVAGSWIGLVPPFPHVETWLQGRRESWGEKGPVLEAFTWNASDLKDFPILIEMQEKQNTVRMRFTEVRFVKPDAKQFDLPTNYGQMK